MHPSPRCFVSPCLWEDVGYTLLCLVRKGVTKRGKRCGELLLACVHILLGWSVLLKKTEEITTDYCCPQPWKTLLSPDTALQVYSNLNVIQS